MKSLCFLISFFACQFTFSQEQKGIPDWTFFINPVKVKVESKRTSDDLNEMARNYINLASNGYFFSVGVNTGYVKAKITKDYAKLTFHRNSFGQNYKALNIKLTKSDENTLEVKASLQYSHVKHLYKAEDGDDSRPNRWKFSNQLENDLKVLFQ